MFRFLVMLILFGGIAVAGLLYFDLIELTPSGQGLVDDAGELIEGVLDGDAGESPSE